AVDRLALFLEGVISGGAIPNPVASEAYGLDGTGNRAEHRIGQTTYANAVDPMNRYTPEYNGDLDLEYDERGNTTTYGDLSLTYDVQGRIVRAQKPGMSAVYVYDGYDRRLLKRVNGADTVFVMEGDRVLQEVAGSMGDVERQYVWGSGIDELVVFAPGSARCHVHHDVLGSPVLLTDSNGDAVERYDYNPFGSCHVTDEDGGELVGNPYRFTGRSLDSETGLYYFRARHYSTHIGRFLSRDPIGIWGDPGNMGNAYAYVGNNPLAASDPSGCRDDWFTTVRPNEHDPSGRTMICNLGVGGDYVFDPSSGPGLIEAAAAVWDGIGEIGQGAVQIGAGFIPVVGEAQDVHVLVSRDSTTGMRAMALGSLILNVLTAGFAPNVGGVARAADDIVEGADDAARAGQRLLPELGGPVAPRGGSGGRISMDEAVERGANFTGPKGEVREVGGGIQFESAPGPDGTKNVARFDVNPGSSHVQREGSHLNLETHVPDGTGGYTAEGAPGNHTPIDPSTVRPGDY
ncbi:MAG: RHS repeat-associated core domain-containing protein, partial [Candidatus Zixiibacteriota bacterium]